MRCRKSSTPVMRQKGCRLAWRVEEAAGFGRVGRHQQAPPAGDPWQQRQQPVHHYHQGAWVASRLQQSTRPSRDNNSGSCGSSGGTSYGGGSQAAAAAKAHPWPPGSGRSRPGRGRSGRPPRKSHAAAWSPRRQRPRSCSAPRRRQRRAAPGARCRRRRRRRGRRWRGVSAVRAGRLADVRRLPKPCAWPERRTGRSKSAPWLARATQALWL